MSPRRALMEDMDRVDVVRRRLSPPPASVGHRAFAHVPASWGLSAAFGEARWRTWTAGDNAVPIARRCSVPTSLVVGGRAVVLAERTRAMRWKGVEGQPPLEGECTTNTHLPLVCAWILYVRHEGLTAVDGGGREVRRVAEMCG
jgi:hypothetical protein